MDLGTKASACVFTCLSGVSFYYVSVCIQSLLLWTAFLMSIGKWMLQKAPSVASCAMEVPWLPFLRSYAGGRWMMHDNSVSGLQASLLNFKFSSHFIWMSGSLWISVGKWIWEGNGRNPFRTLLLQNLRSVVWSVNQAYRVGLVRTWVEGFSYSSLKKESRFFFLPDICTTREGTPWLA